MKVPLLDLHEQLKPLREEIIAAVTEVIDSTIYIMGPKVEQLEREVAAYSGASQGIGVASGTDALLAVLMTIGVGPGDLVLTTPYSFFATMGCVLRLGAKPLFVDIDPVSYNLDPALLEAALAADPARTSRIKAIIPVHLYGQCADMARIMEIAGRYSIPVVEDAAQAIGAACPLPENGEVVWRRAGSMGLAGCFSFFPSKNLGGVGDGGMVVCQDAEFAERLRVIRVHGGAPKYHHGVVGGNFRLDPIQAVVLSIKLAHLDSWHRQRRENAERYRRLFRESGLLEGGRVKLPVAVYESAAAGATGSPDYHIYNQFVIRADRRDQLRSHLQGAGIGVEVYYPIPLHRQKCLAGLGYEGLTYPASEQAAAQTLALPIYPELTAAMQEQVVETIASFYAQGA